MCCIGIGKARLIKKLADQAAQINSPHTREPATAQIKPSNNKHSSTEESTASQLSSPTSSSESPNPGPASPGKRKLPAQMEISVRSPSTSGFQQQPNLFPGGRPLFGASASQHQSWAPPPFLAFSVPPPGGFTTPGHLPQLPSTLNPSTSSLWDQLTTLQHPNTFHIQTSITQHSHLPYLP